MELFLVPHSHWDREWYMNFELHRQRLVRLLDSVVEALSKDEKLRFHMDGQVVALTDYLEIRPRKLADVRRLVRNGQLSVGPFYILQDCFLTSGEAHIRNILVGRRVCRELGIRPGRIGYYPDSFGLISQVPQILEETGLAAAVFGRSVTRQEYADYPECAKLLKSEWRWRSPDGSETLAIVLTNWYGNAFLLPLSDEPLMRARLDEVVENCRRFAGTEFFLGMNGGDHAPFQERVMDFVNAANGFREDCSVRLSGLEEYADRVLSGREGFPVFCGEVDGQLTDGFGLLAGTASCRARTKRENFRAQKLLEREIEPLALLAMLEGGTPDRGYLLYAWKMLLSCHPHDSICGCCVDSVARDVDNRLDRLNALLSGLRDEYMRKLCENVDTSDFPGGGIAVFHGSPRVRAAETAVVLSFDKPTRFHLQTAEGGEVACSVRCLGERFTYSLPDDGFRQASRKWQYEVVFTSESRGVGYRTYRIVEGDPLPVKPRITALADRCSTPFLELVFLPDGGIDVTDKRTGRVYSGLNRFEDVADAGTTYDFLRPSNAQAVSPSRAEITLAELGEDFARYRIAASYRAVSYDPERAACVEGGGVELVTTVTVNCRDSALRFHVELTNAAENHRLRVLFPMRFGERALCRTPFDLTSRGVRPWEHWKNPERPLRCSGYLLGEDGLLAGRGLYEYEAVGESAAVTLLRSVGEMGDWGTFETPDAQCLGRQECDYLFVPCEGNAAAAISLAEDWLTGSPFAVQVPCHAGRLPAGRAYFRLEGDFIELTACKLAENRDSAILRLVNLDAESRRAAVFTERAISAAYRCSAAERRRGKLKAGPRCVELTLPAKKIFTLELTFDE